MGEAGPHPAAAVRAIHRQDSAIAIWDGSQKRQGSCIFNCSEEQSLITIIEHSGSLQTHLALLIWEQESTKHKFLFCSPRQKAFFFSSFFFSMKINKIGDLRISKREGKRFIVENETSQCVSVYGGGKETQREIKENNKNLDNAAIVHLVTLIKASVCSKNIHLLGYSLCLVLH